MNNYGTSKSKEIRYIFNIIDAFRKITWSIALRNKNSMTMTDEFSNILTISKRKPLKIKNDRGGEWYNSIFQNFLKLKNIQHNSRFTDKRPGIAERGIRAVRNLLNKPVFLKGKADWLRELPSVIKQYKKTAFTTQLKWNRSMLPEKQLKKSLLKSSRSKS